MTSMPSKLSARWNSRDRWRIAGLYIAAGILWILATDYAVNRFVTEPTFAGLTQTVKGILFVLATGILFFVVLSGLARTLRQARGKARAATLNYLRLLETAYEGVWIVARDGSTIRTNARMAEILGVASAALEPARAEDVLDAGGAMRLRAMLAGERTTRGNGFLATLAMPGGKPVWAHIAASPVQSDEGDTIGVLLMVTDVAALKAAEESLARALKVEQVLLRELNHRVRNNLQALVALVEVTRRDAPDTAEFARVILGRVRALSAAYDLLLESKWQPVKLRDVLASIVESADRTLEGRGPDIEIPAHLAAPLAAAGHELLINARERSDAPLPASLPVITWRIEASEGGSPVLIIEWESTVLTPQAVAGPQALSVELAKGLIRSDLHGSFEIKPSAGKSLCSIRFPIVSDVLAYAAAGDHPRLPDLPSAGSAFGTMEPQ
jgi:PAS domain S-box-containing protein